MIEVTVRENNIDQACRTLRKKLQIEGTFREVKLRRQHEKPSVRKARKTEEAKRRRFNKYKFGFSSY